MRKKKKHFSQRFTVLLCAKSVFESSTSNTVSSCGERIYYVTENVKCEPRLASFLPNLETSIAANGLNSCPFFLSLFLFLVFSSFFVVGLRPDLSSSRMIELKGTHFFFTLQQLCYNGFSSRTVLFTLVSIVYFSLLSVSFSLLLFPCVA